MENQKEDIQIKTRSSQACIRDGYRLYVSRFRLIFRQTWLAAICYSVFTSLATALVVLLSPTLLLPCALLMIATTVIFLWAAYRRLLKRQLLERIPKTSGAKGWLRHFGMVLLVMLIGLMAVAMLSLITSLPTLIIALANWQAQMGVLAGDPLGMPSYMNWLTVSVLLLIGFLQAYVWLTLLFPIHLMRGSIACQEQERLDFNKQK